MRYSIKPRYRIYFGYYGLLSFPKMWTKDWGASMDKSFLVAQKMQQQMLLKLTQTEQSQKR